ncbi:MAG: hypothetical protein H7Y11_15580 [Armatimonadetes bacterium]|nr:hypothetical protein [Anaerolineae bacterium]
MVLLPQKRDELFHYLRALASLDYQQQVWLEGVAVPGIGQDSFGYALTFFFHDTMLAEAPENNLGTILEYDSEVPVIRRVGEALILVLTQYGDDRPDADYVTCAEWEAVVTAASEAVGFYGIG